MKDSLNQDITFVGEGALALAFDAKPVAYVTEEDRTLDGWDESGKRGSTRFERIPEKLLGAVSLNTPKEYASAFLPEGLSTPFTVKEYAEKIRQKPRWAYQGIRILMDLGVLSHIGERGREFLYAPSND